MLTQARRRTGRGASGTGNARAGVLHGVPELAGASLAAIENGGVRLGVERAKVLARALKCHPAALVFPGWESEEQSAA
jgi:hypothetical protein